MYELPHKLTDDYIFKKSLEGLGLMVSTQLATQNANFDICARTSQKISLKKFRGNTSFVNLLTIFYPRLKIKRCKKTHIFHLCHMKEDGASIIFHHKNIAPGLLRFHVSTLSGCNKNLFSAV